MATWATPTTFTAGQTAGVSTGLNNHATDLTVIGQSWQSYTPTTTGITVGSGGTVTGRYNQTGKTVDFACKFTFGTGSAITGSPTFTLPATAQTANWIAAESSAFDLSATAFWPVAAIADTTARVSCLVWPTTAGDSFRVISSTVPFTWATGDVLLAYGRYEAA